MADSFSECSFVQYLVADCKRNFWPRRGLFRKSFGCLGLGRGDFERFAVGAKDCGRSRELPSDRSDSQFAPRNRVDFAQLIKSYSSSQQVTRYSPAKISGAEKIMQFGNPDYDKICTSHVERFNLTLRMTVRRFTRLTNAQSKSLKHHVAMQKVFFAYYNFCRKHATIKQTPAMAAGLENHKWTIKELIERAAAN